MINIEHAPRLIALLVCHMKSALKMEEFDLRQALFIKQEILCLLRDEPEFMELVHESELFSLIDEGLMKLYGTLK